MKTNSKKKHFEEVITEFQKFSLTFRPESKDQRQIETHLTIGTSLEELNVDSQTIDLSWIRSGSTRKPFSFKHVRFKGASRIIGTAKVPIIFEECLFEKIYLSANFSKGVAFALNIFGEIEIENSNFYAGVSIFGDAGFYLSIFEKKLAVRNSTFHDLGAFTFCHFNGYTYFQETQFYSHLLFENNDFTSLIEFRNVKILGELQFSTSHNRFDRNLFSAPFTPSFFAQVKSIFLENKNYIDFFNFDALEKIARNKNDFRIQVKNKHGIWMKGINFFRYVFGLSTIYYLISNYGNSILRPVLIFFCSTIITSVVFALNSSVDLFDGTSWTIAPLNFYGVPYYFSAAVKGFLHPIYAFELIRIKWGFPIVCYIFNTAIQFLSFGLLALAIRRKFKSI